MAAARRRAGGGAGAGIREEDEEDMKKDATMYEPPVGVPADTIFFRYNKFQHNARIAAFLLPAAAVLVVFGGKLTTGMMVGGALVSYFLDFLGLRDATFVAVWTSVFAVVISLFMASTHLFAVTMFNVALVYNMLITCACIGLWATLQFSFLQRQHPRLVLIFERLLFAVVPAAPSVIMTWAAVAYNGMHAAPFILLAILTAAFCLYVLPQRSSFRVLGAGRRKGPSPVVEELDEIVMGRFETAVHTVAYCMLPCFFKVAIHHTHLIASQDDVADLVLLTAVPMLIVVALAPLGSLWWLGISAGVVGLVRKALAASLVLIIVGAIEVRVVFHSLAHYIKLAPPWNYVAVTAALYLLALIALAHAAGLLESRIAAVFLTAMAAAAAAAGCTALGMPVYLLPVGVVAAVFWVRFYYNRVLGDYLVFVGASSVAIGWFIIRTFFFLDFEFDPLPMSLRHVCLVLIAFVTASLLIPGLVASKRTSADINGLVLCVHTAGLTLLELQLHCQFKGIYPTYLVCLSSAAGMRLAEYLFQEGRISLTTAWGMGAIYCGKLGLAINPSLRTLVAALCTVMAISPIYVGVLYLVPREGRRFGTGGGKGGAVARSIQQLPFALTGAQVAGLSLASSAIALVWMRQALVGVVVRMMYARASETCVVGCVLAVWPVANLGVTTHLLPGSAALRQALAACLCLGLTLMAVEPDVNVIFGHHRRGGGGEWAAWCLVGCACLLLALCSAPIRRQGALRTLAAGGAGALLGVYFDVRFLPPSPLLLAGTALNVTCAAIFVASLLAIGLARGGGAGGGAGMQLIFVVFVAMLPMTYMVQPSLLRAIPAGYRGEALEQRRSALLGMHAALALLIALCVKLKAARIDAATAAVVGGGMRARAARAAAGGKSVSELAPWLISAGNIAAVLALVLAQHLCVMHLHAPHTVIFALVPVLLLLQPDTGLFAALSDTRRYFPLVMVPIVYLSCAVIYELLLRHYLQEHRWGPRGVARTPAMPTMMLVKNLVLLAVSLPGHYMFCRFMWTFRHTRDLFWVALLPLNVLPVILTDLPTIRLLAALCIAGGLTQLFLADRIRKHGLRFV